MHDQIGSVAGDLCWSYGGKVLVNRAGLITGGGGVGESHLQGRLRISRPFLLKKMLPGTGVLAKPERREGSLCVNPINLPAPVSPRKPHRRPVLRAPPFIGLGPTRPWEPRRRRPFSHRVVQPVCQQTQRPLPLGHRGVPPCRHITPARRSPMADCVGDGARYACRDERDGLSSKCDWTLFSPPAP